MSLTLRESYERSCRLCAEEQDVTIMIFSPEAEALHLVKKLNKYLLIEIAENDKLPKNICIKCCNKLQTVCEFIDTARKAQETLTNKSVLLEGNTTGDVYENVTTICTDYFDYDNTVTQMEVNVDPMMVLQNSESALSPRNCESIPDDSDDLSHLHGLEGENVTIKLIKKHQYETDMPDDPKKKSDTENKPFPCLVCKRGFLTELALRNHSWIHSGDAKSSKLFKCPDCGDGFDFRCDLLVHIRQHRSCISCKICGRNFRSPENLKLHIESHDSPYKTHVCKVCGRAYNNKSNLKTHSITHSSERPFKCHLCKKSFKRNQDLKFHINQHTGAKPYKCPFCDKSFASSGNCYAHRSRMHPDMAMNGHGKGWRRIVKVSRENHTSLKQISPTIPLINVKGVFKYQCQYCDHTFTKKDNCMYHIYQHTGEKPFRCSWCSEEFVTRKGLCFHHEKMHPDKERPLAMISKNALLK